MNYKIVLAGDIGVGKTSLINRFVTGIFTDDYKPTIGVNIYIKELFIDNSEVNLQIWDVAGQTSFRQFRQRFFCGAQGAFIVFDLTVPKSLENLHVSWIEDIQNNAGEIPLILIGNKVDLKESITVSRQDITDFLIQHSNVEDHFITSALTGENVENAFTKLTALVR
ncbi:MAG: GTP-binding protein [Candidatus Heimdallarchaeota archaeon]|nr:MAG: GTP-binding protein [Candidatus Heimdallarchaeota archaeon]